jgi:hypothetical protein
MAAPDAIRLKVIAINCKYRARIERFGGSHQRSVREVHGAIRIQFHKFERPYQRSLFEEPDRHRIPSDKFPQPISSCALRLKHMECFRQHCDGRTNRRAYRFQSSDASFVVLILGIEQRHQRSRVHENHRPSFRLSASRTPRRVSEEGAIAEPPAPKSSVLYTS